MFRVVVYYFIDCIMVQMHSMRSSTNLALLPPLQAGLKLQTLHHSQTEIQLPVKDEAKGADTCKPRVKGQTEGGQAAAEGKALGWIRRGPGGCTPSACALEGRLFPPPPTQRSYASMA